MMSTLNLPQIAESQALAYVTSNDADARLEQALCAARSIPVPNSGDVTLTAEQFQTAWYFNLTGTPGAPFALILPAVSRPFMLRNQSGMTVTVKTGTGTAVPVLTAETRMLYSDGVTVRGLSDTVSASGTGSSGAPASHSGALVSLAADRTVASSGPTLVEWGSQHYDTDGFYDGSLAPKRFTIPSDVSKVIVSCQLRWDTNSVGVRELALIKNGSLTYDGRASSIAKPTGLSTIQYVQSPVLPVAAGDYFEIVLYQGSGSSRSVISHASSWFSLQAIG